MSGLVCDLDIIIKAFKILSSCAREMWDINNPLDET